MTLSTYVAIGKPYPVREIFDFARTLLNTPKETPVDDWGGRCEKGVKWMGNPCGIGLPAWLIVRYGADGPFPLHEHDKYCAVELGGEYDVTQEQIDAHAEQVANDPMENGWTATVVDFDTAYGYWGEDGESCSDLHARLITALGNWLDSKGLPWKWCNEFTGEWFDRYNGLDSFGDAFKTTGAQDWFANTVLPAIASGRI